MISLLTQREQGRRWSQASLDNRHGSQEATRGGRCVRAFEELDMDAVNSNDPVEMSVHIVVESRLGSGHLETLSEAGDLAGLMTSHFHWAVNNLG